MDNIGSTAYAFNLKSVEITGIDGTTFEIAALVYGFKYYEDINAGFISGNLRVVDSGENLRGRLPIQGYERVKIIAVDANNDEYEYQFFVYRISEVSISEGVQSYNLGLVTKEAIENEQIRVNQTFKDAPHAIVENICSQYFPDVDLNYDVTTNHMALHGANRSPFKIFHSLQDRSLDTSSGAGTSGQVDENTKKMAGSGAGFVFYRDKDGLCFKSLNQLCDPSVAASDTEVIYTFTDAISPNETANEYTITSLDFLSEINILEGLRLGAYNTELQTLNIDTMEFTRSIYSFAEQYDSQSHLGSSGIQESQKIMSKTPARVASAVISNETFSSGKKDSREDENFSFLDKTQELIAQSFSRNYILNTQGLRIEIPGNLDLTVGNRVRIHLTNSITQEQRATEDIDIYNSGFYLITQLSRFFNKATNKCTTVLKLQRDSHGSEEDLSSTT